MHTQQTILVVSGDKEGIPREAVTLSLPPTQTAPTIRSFMSVPMSCIHWQGPVNPKHAAYCTGTKKVTSMEVVLLTPRSRVAVWTCPNLRLFVQVLVALAANQLAGTQPTPQTAQE